MLLTEWTDYRSIIYPLGHTVIHALRAGGLRPITYNKMDIEKDFCICYNASRQKEMKSPR